MGPLPSSRTGLRAGGSPIRSHSRGTTVGRRVAVRGYTARDPAGLERGHAAVRAARGGRGPAPVRPVRRPEGVEHDPQRWSDGPAPYSAVRPPGPVAATRCTPSRSPSRATASSARTPNRRRAGRGTAERGGDQRVESRRPPRPGGAAAASPRLPDVPPRPDAAAGWSWAGRRGRRRRLPVPRPVRRRARGTLRLGVRCRTMRPDTARRVCHSAKSERPSNSARRFSSALSDCANSRMRTGSLAVRWVVTCGRSVQTRRPSPGPPPPSPTGRGRPGADAQPVGPLGGGQRGDDRPQQFRAAAARRALDQQVRALRRQVHGHRAARAGAEHGPRPAAERVGVVGRVRPAGHQGGGCGPGEAQFVEQPGGRGAAAPHAAGAARRRRHAVRAQRREGPCEALGPGEGDRVHRADRAGAPGPGRSVAPRPARPAAAAAPSPRPR